MFFCSFIKVFEKNLCLFLLEGEKKQDVFNNVFHVLLVNRRGRSSCIVWFKERWSFELVVKFSSLPKKMRV